MSRFGGILFALEQAVARDNFGSIHGRHSNTDDADDAVQNSPTPNGGAEDDPSNSKEEHCGGHFVGGNNLERVPNFAGSDNLIPGDAGCAETTGNKSQEENAEKSEHNSVTGRSRLRATASEWNAKPGLPKTARRNENRRRRQQKRREKERRRPTKTVGDRDFAADSDATSSRGLHARASVGDEGETSAEENTEDTFPWRKFVPEGAVDPISLELLAENDYPPFALVVDGPYTPMYPNMWPPVDTNEDDTNTNQDRELAILKQQWGDGVAVESEKKEDDALPSLSSRKFNLFDGHILAIYLVATQQFIDPFNRRDLTRGELEALDDYLAHNDLSYAGVCLAYDNRALISTAGTRAQSAAGRAAARADISRRNADSILTQMFTIRNTEVGASTRRKKGKSGDATSGAEKVKMIGREAMNSLRQTGAVRGDAGCEFRDGEALEANLRLPTPDETGVYEGEGGGLLIIDDDVNPGLRGRVEVDDRAARHFPSLATAKGDSISTTAHTWGSQNSLSMVCKPAGMADPKELAEQRRTEKEAEKRRPAEELAPRGVCKPAKMANLLAEKRRKERGAEEQRQAEELRLRSNAVTKTGWSRPVTGNANPAQYTATIIARATVHLADLVKLEKKFIGFLADDAKPSLSLKPMASESLRKLVREYCKHWKLHTVGSLEAARDPSQEVCIECGKLDDTCVPRPLLSDAAKHPVLGVTVSLNFKKKKKGKKKVFELAW